MAEIVKLEDAARDMRKFFVERKGAIRMALARAGVTEDRIIQALFTAGEKTPDLYFCEVRSVYKAILLAAQAGLMPDGITQQAHLIPRRNRKKRGQPLECNLQIGYRGYLTLCRRSGEVTVIKGTLVRKGDKFHEYRGTDDRIVHEPLAGILDPETGKPRPITHAYAVAKFKTGEVDFEVMPVEEIDALRKRAGAYDDGPWKTDYGEMCKKTVMRRLCKRLPQSEDASRLLELDAKAEGGIDQDLARMPVPGLDDEDDQAEPADVEEIRDASDELARAAGMVTRPETAGDEGPERTAEAPGSTGDALAPAEPRSVPADDGAPADSAPFDPDESARLEREDAEREARRRGGEDASLFGG